MIRKSILLFLFLISTYLHSQNRYELNEGWKCKPATELTIPGEEISSPHYVFTGWKPAVVPGTVLTTQLFNGEIPDPFYGMNNELIPDIYETGRDYYTYWFVKEFEEDYPKNAEQVWLTFRGINYRVEIFLNGKKVNNEVYEGMFLRKTFNITNLLSKNRKNRLAVTVYPPDHVGKPNGGQGGDGTIARNLTHQYVAGWDWIQPIRDRNTGIWDKVYIEKTGNIDIRNPHLITIVPGKSKPEGKQENAILKVSAELHNASDRKIKGTLYYSFDSDIISTDITLEANSETEIYLPEYIIKNPRLWWPAGYGEQHLYDIRLEFKEAETKSVSDYEDIRFGIREIKKEWNERTRSAQILVNGQKIFIKGGNWIISDAMLRFSKERYDAEIRYHRDMNLNLIRIWGGAITERPEFYEACDKYGLLVIQDFWMSGDCNGRWVDPLKYDDQWGRRKYPDNHTLFLEAAADMIKMIRNHPSLAIWCGGNEIMPPSDILISLRDSILPALDGTRWFINYSNSDEMSYNFIGGVGDGPYTIQPPESFWQKQTYPFNSEVGSVGVGDFESLTRFIPEKNLVIPVYIPEAKEKEIVDPVWTYHRYKGVSYENYIDPYGKPKDIRDFAMKAQLVNYNQYRALMEGFSSHMWEWYTGTIIWKTQNPWTAMRGQMYDYYLDPNACLFGLRKGSEKLHIMCNPVDGWITIANNGFEQQRDLIVAATTYNMEGKEQLLSQILAYVEASDTKKVFSVKRALDRQFKDKGGFLYLQLFDEKQNVLSDNFYWYPDSTGNYSGLKEMKEVIPEVSAKYISEGKIEVNLFNYENSPIAFFNRISLIDSNTGKRILPVFYDDNYISVLPGKNRKITVEYTHNDSIKPFISVKGWNVKEQIIPIG